MFPDLRLPESRRRFRRKQPEEPTPRKTGTLSLFDTATSRESPGTRPANPEHAVRTEPRAPEPRREPEPARRDEGLGASGEVGKAKEILDAVRVLKQIEDERRLPTGAERETLARFGGFGAVALSLFPDPIHRTYKSPSWQALGEELERFLSPEEYASAKRTVFNAFYTSPIVVKFMFTSIARLGVPEDATVLEPGCGSGNFLQFAPKRMRMLGVELDSLSGRIARALYPHHDIRIESFRDTRLPEATLDAVIGNPPFADVMLEHRGQRYALHDFFLAKSLDGLKPGGVLALVTSHFTLDKQNGSVRESLAERADFLGAIRLPSDAFKREGTKVVTDIVFLQKRAPDEPIRHVDPSWLSVAPLAIEGVEVTINRYFHAHPEQVLGSWSRKDRLYGGEEGYSVEATGELSEQLREALNRLPELSPRASSTSVEQEAKSFTPPPLETHITEGSFFVGEDRTIYQMVDGTPEAVNYGGTLLTSNGTMTGKRLARLVAIRDAARLVLQSQNEGWPASHREEARRELNRQYDVFVSQYGLINKTTFSEAKTGTIIQRMPNVAKFVEDPDAMLVMAIEQCDPSSGTATKATIMVKDVVGRAPEVTTVATAEEGLLVSLDKKGVVDVSFIASLYGKDEATVIEELGDLIYHDPAAGELQTADEYLSGNVREKLAQAEAAGPEFARNAEALRAVQPEDVLPGEIDANLGAPWVPEGEIRAFAAELFGVPPSSISIGRLKKDALWSVEAGYDATSGVPASSDFGTARANGITLFEQALNLKTPVIFDVVNHGDREERVVNQEETLAAREKQKRIKDAFRSWVFADPERCEQLVRIYNDTYNNLRLRVFDGSHLEFPGMNQTVSLHPHQQDAIWRGISSGNTLLGHVVGSGKTYTMCAIGMKRRQAGLSKKTLVRGPEPHA